MTKLFFAVLCLIGLVGALPNSAVAAYDSAFKVYNLDGSIPDDGLLAVIDQAVRETKLTRQVALGEVADTTLLREAQRELGIKAR